MLSVFPRAFQADFTEFQETLLRFISRQLAVISSKAQALQYCLWHKKSPAFVGHPYIERHLP